jgi:hypothetical protein
LTSKGHAAYTQLIESLHRLVIDPILAEPRTVLDGLRSEYRYNLQPRIDLKGLLQANLLDAETLIFARQ